MVYKLLSLYYSALEIEHVLCDHQGVKECAVIGVPDALNGESIVAVIVLQNDIVSAIVTGLSKTEREEFKFIYVNVCTLIIH